SSFFEQLRRTDSVFESPFAPIAFQLVAALHVQLVCLWVRGVSLREQTLFVGRQPHHQRVCHSGRNTVLQSQHLAAFLIELLGPSRSSGRSAAEVSNGRMAIV